MSGSSLEMITPHPLLRKAMQDDEPCTRVDTTGMSTTQKAAVEQLGHVCQDSANDLTWMRIYMHVINPFVRAPGEGVSNASGTSRP